MPQDNDPPARVLDTSPISLPPLDATDGAAADTEPPTLLGKVIEVQPPEQQQAMQQAMQPTHVRIGGNAGLRVQHFEGGVTTHKRVTAIDAPASDHRPVPIAVLEEVRELLYSGSPPAAAPAVLTRVRDLLAPWLELP